MIDYKIAVPSYQRSKTIQDKTFKVFEQHNIPPEKVTVFVADDSEYEVYSKELADHKYGKNIVVGVPTIGAQRNWIEKYYPEGTYLMMFDDDVQEVQRRNENVKLEPIDDLYSEVIEAGFRACEEHGAKTFGIYAASNAFFMKERVQTKLCYVIASMFGVIVEHDDYLARVTNHGEDYEYSLRQYVKHGVLARLDWITVKSNYYKEEGGLQAIRTEEYVYNSIKKISELFPELCSMYVRETTGHAELRLKDKSGGKYQKTNETSLEEFFG